MGSATEERQGGRGRARRGEVAKCVVEGVSCKDKKSKPAKSVIVKATAHQQKAIKSTNTLLREVKGKECKLTKLRAVDIMLNGVTSRPPSTTKEARARALEPPSSAPPVPESAKDSIANPGKGKAVQASKVVKERVSPSTMSVTN